MSVVKLQVCCGHESFANWVRIQQFFRRQKRWHAGLVLRNREKWYTIEASNLSQHKISNITKFYRNIFYWDFLNKGVNRDEIFVRFKTCSILCKYLQNFTQWKLWNNRMWLRRESPYRRAFYNLYYGNCWTQNRKNIILSNTLSKSTSKKLVSLPYQQ